MPYIARNPEAFLNSLVETGQCVALAERVAMAPRIYGMTTGVAYAATVRCPPTIMVNGHRHPLAGADLFDGPPPNSRA
jgi:hypothetical protein